MLKVIIIGAGPAGSMAAIAASRAGAKVVLIDKNKEYCKKLAITGNGKCNYSNSSISDNLDVTNYNFDKDSHFADLLRKYNQEWLTKYFRSFGMMSYKKGELLYPRSEQSISVIYALKCQLNALGIEVKNLEAKQIQKCGDSFNVICEGNTVITGDRLIIATGGKAAPKTGSEGGGYKLARSLGHTVSYTYPGLCKLSFDKDKYNYLSNAAGTRVKVLVEAYVDDEKKATEAGELQLTQDALSGICIFNLSRHISKPVEEGKNAYVIIDFVPGVLEEELSEFLGMGLKFDRSLEMSLSGIIPKGLAENLAKAFPEKRDLVKALKNMKVSINGHGSFNDAQITIGGVLSNEIDEGMQSKITPSLYFAGEIIDVDGNCGGYNLHWAFASGFVAGSSAAKA